MIRELGLKSYMCVPLQAHGRTLGAITFRGSESCIGLFRRGVCN